MVVIGLVGIVMPALPGHVLILGGLILAAWADEFRHVGVWTLVAIGVIAAASYAIDFVAAAVSTRRLGASRRAMAGAALGTLAGFFFGLIGLLVGPFVGAVVGELTASGDVRQAGRAGVAATIGFMPRHGCQGRDRVRDDRDLRRGVRLVATTGTALAIPDAGARIRPSAGWYREGIRPMTPTEMETLLQNLDARWARIEQILPTLATRDDLAASSNVGCEPG